MDTVVYDRIEDVLGRIESLYGRVEDTYLVAKDILLGTQISDWIADLKASGTASATYSDATRMNALIANEDAVNTVQIMTILCDWSVSNNKAGTYLKTYFSKSEIDWQGVESITDAYSNSEVFSLIANDQNMFNTMMSLASCKTAMFNCYETTESILANSPYMSAITSSNKILFWFDRYGHLWEQNSVGKNVDQGKIPKTGAFWIDRIRGGYNSGQSLATGSVVYADNSGEEISIVKDSSDPLSVKRFIKKAESNGGNFASFNFYGVIMG